MKDGDLVTPNNGPPEYRRARPVGIVLRVWCTRKLGSGQRGQSYATVDWKWDFPGSEYLVVGGRTKHFPENLSSVPQSLDSEVAESSGAHRSK
jgi:hypothetical protein